MHFAQTPTTPHITSTPPQVRFGSPPPSIFDLSRDMASPSSSSAIQPPHPFLNQTLVLDDNLAPTTAILIGQVNVEALVINPNPYIVQHPTHTGMPNSQVVSRATQEYVPVKLRIIPDNPDATDIFVYTPSQLRDDSPVAIDNFAVVERKVAMRLQPLMCKRVIKLEAMAKTVQSSSNILVTSLVVLVFTPKGNVSQITEALYKYGLILERPGLMWQSVLTSGSLIYHNPHEIQAFLPSSTSRCAAPATISSSIEIQSGAADVAFQNLRGKEDVPETFRGRHISIQDYLSNLPLFNPAAIRGPPPYEFRPDAQYADPIADYWARYYSQGGTDPAGAMYFRSVPGIKESTTTSPSLNESNAMDYSVGSAEDSRETAAHLPAESIHTADGFSELERLMQEKLPLNLTGEVVVADYREPKHGGFAFVYKGVWKGKEMTVKRLKYKKNLKKPAPWEGSMQRRLTREINVWAVLSHRNIAEFLGFAEDFGDFPAMISTWYNLGTARDYLDENEDMAVAVRIRLVQNVADGIEYLHDLKIIHGDLKPTNILIDDNHMARLCDFGLVRLDDWQGPAGMTTTSPYTGTERYKAPELFISATNRHPRATCEGDIYALGCIALEIIESTIPFERYRDSYGLAKAVADGESPASPPKELESGPIFVQHLWFFLKACWEHPENRFKVNQIVVELIYLSELQSILLEAQ